MKIWFGQINMELWNVTKNTDKVIETIEKLGENCDVLVFPELTLPWSPWNDLYENDQLIRDQYEAVNTIHNYIKTIKNELTVILWFIEPDEKNQQPWWWVRKYNAAAAITKDSISTTYKENLCDYDVFYESRQLHPGRKYVNFNIWNDIKATLTICEDLFNPLHDNKVLENRDMEWIEYIFNLSSSPFATWKLERRIDAMKEHATTRDANVVYLNQIGAQDDNIFDWSSFIVDNKGQLVHLAKQFEQDTSIVDMNVSKKDITAEANEISRNKYEQIEQAMILGLKDYLAKTWLSKVVIWVSWWIDSAISLYFLSKVLSPENIVALYMPSKHSTNSKTDAHTLAENLWITLQEREIQTRFDAIQERNQKELWKKLSHNVPEEKIAYENIQARIRWEILMQTSNLTPWSMIINNSNKTEMLMWYGTLHGDMIWAVNLIWDLNKREVYELAEYINTKNEAIPTNIISKPASAELNVDQVDPFDYHRVSDAIDALWNWASPHEVSEEYDVTLEEAKDYAKKIRYTEYKRREFYPIIMRLKSRNMWIWRRYPVVRAR